MYSVFVHARKLPGIIGRSAPLKRGVRRGAVVGVASFAMLLLSLVPAMSVGAQSFYPPNAVVSSYFDPRYCGNGAVSVVTDAGGSLINICTSTGQRVVPIYPDYVVAPYGGYGYGYAQPAYNYGYTYNAPTYAYAAPVYNNTANYGYGYATGTYYGNNATNGNTLNGYGTYNDNRTNCPGGQVTSTPSGYFCTANGFPAGA